MLDESESFKTLSKTGVDERGTREMEVISYGGLAGKAKNAVNFANAEKTVRRRESERERERERER